MHGDDFTKDILFVSPVVGFTEKTRLERKDARLPSVEAHFWPVDSRPLQAADEIL